MKSAIYHPYLMRDVLLASASRLFTVVSMCAGGGGSSAGYRLAGGVVLLANEFVAEAARTYGANFPDTIVDERDMREITATPASVLDFIGQAGLVPGELDILDGSTPCNNLSTAGPGVPAEGATVTLVYNFFYMAGVVRPKVVVAENVPAFASEKNRPILDAALDGLRFCGPSRSRQYYAAYAVVNAADVGAPQRRRRLIMIALRKDVAEAIGINDDAGVLAIFPEPTHDHVSVRTALAEVQQGPADKDPYVRAALTTAMGSVVLQLPHDPPTPIFPRHAGLPKESWFTMIRAAWDWPSPTLTALGSGPNGLSGVIHPAEDRKFTIPEQKRLHGLADDYFLSGTIAQAAERMGNMVPPPLMRAVATNILDRVLRPHREKLR